MDGRLRDIRENLEALKSDLGVKEAADPAGSRRWVEAVRRGRIFFYGDREIEIGLKGIDWSGRHVHHQEWPAQLNRFFALPHLVAVYRATGEEDIPKLARALIEDWIDQHDYSAEAPPARGDNTLNISIRLGQSTRHGWWASVPYLADGSTFDDVFVARMIESTRGQLACLRAHISPQSNWRISHLDTMLFCALVVPELDAHREFAVRNLNEAFHRQIHADGSHEEHNPSYHAWMCEVFTSYLRLSRKRPELGLAIDPERVVRMWDYAVCSTAPDGGSVGLHDGGVWSGGPGRIAKLAQRAALVREMNLAGDAADLDGSPSRYFADAGQVFIRDGWQSDAAMVIFDATRWGGSHCHLSRNSVNLYAGSRMLLCDPGVFSYEMSDPYAPHGKSTPAHNTVNLAGMSQSEADPHVRRVALFDEAAVVNASYEGGYWPGQYTWSWYEGKHPGLFGMHGRTLLWLRGRCAVVWDVIAFDREGQRYAAHWQFPAGPHEADAARLRARTRGGAHNVLVQLLASDDAMSLMVNEGRDVPLRGWLPKGGPGNYEPAPQVVFEAIAANRYAVFATLLLPFAGDDEPDFEVRASRSANGRGLCFRLCWADGDEDLVCATPNLMHQVGEAGALTTDAALAAVALRDGKPRRTLLVDGMYAELDGQVLAEQPQGGVYLLKH